MRFGLLGTVVVVDGAGELVPVRWPMARSVLAALLLNANRVVSTDRLVDVVWGDDPPANAVASLQNHVMRLRALLSAAEVGVIKTVDPGYLIEVAGCEVDLDEFTRRSERARQALAGRDWKSAETELTAALGLWRGDPLADVTSVLLREQELPRLELMRLEALEGWAEAGLRLGRDGDLVAELRRLTAAYPLRERFHAQLMVACYQAGCPAEALRAYQRAETILAEELGVRPGPELRDVHQQILAGDGMPIVGGPRIPVARAVQLVGATSNDSCYPRVRAR